MSIFRYRGYDRLFHKIQKGYKGYVQDHHVIPREFRRHRLITNLNYDINGKDNLFIMPNNKGIAKFNMAPGTLVHDGPHRSYNKYVGEKLDEISENRCTDSQSYYLWLFVSYLKDNLRINKDGIPWK